MKTDLTGAIITALCLMVVFGVLMVAAHTIGAS
jgi:hypothetical protein